MWVVGVGGGLSPDFTMASRSQDRFSMELKTVAGTPIELTDVNFQSTISKGSHVVDFWAAWCGPCRMIAPVLEEIARDRKDVTIGKLNVDENPRTASQFKVQGIPLLVFIKDGKETGRLVGAVPKQQIESAIRQYLG